jgi:diguanylate cyclase (GGDEF)-like protein/PAS domain S-box-containing protein
MKVSLKDRHGCAECPIRAAIDKPGCSAEDAEHRLQMFADLGLLEIRDNPSLDRIVNLASKALKAPVSLVSLIAEDRQVFVAQLGLCSPWREQGETPLSHSFCQYVVATNKVLRVEDARLDPCLKSNGAIKDLGVVAYLGAPLRLDCGVTLGALCLIEPHPRVWTDDDEALLQDYAALVVQEIELRRIARLEMQKGEAIQEKTTQFELALSHMAHGLSFFDRDGRLINANAEYSAIYRLDPAVLQPGTTIQAIMDMRRAIGTNTKLADSEYLAWVGSAQVGEPLRREFELEDGRIIRVFCRATAGGGWVATNEDITDRKRLHNEVETRERLYRLLAENTNDVVILAEVTGARRYFSPAVSRLLGYSPEEASHISMREWIHPNDVDSVFRTTASLTLDTPVSSVIYRLRHKDGHYLWAEAVFRLFKDEEEQLQIVATVRDVSKRKEAEAEYRDLFANANVGLFRMDLDGGLLRANDASAQLCGYGSVETLLSAARRQSQDDELPLDTKEIARSVRSEGELRKFIRMTRRADSGEMVYLMHSAWMVPPKQHMAGAIEGSVLDITDRIRHEQSVRHLAQHDPLTGLPNRAFFQQEVKRHADAKESNVTIAYLDLDLFNNVNDQYGHGAGDECLVEIGRRLLSLAVDSDAVIARLGGDEFAILFVASPPSATEAFVLSVIGAIQRPVVLSVGDDVRLGVSVGLANFDAAAVLIAAEI